MPEVVVLNHRFFNHSKISTAKLVARVRFYIRRYERLLGKNELQDTITCKGLEIDIATHKVFVNGNTNNCKGIRSLIISFLQTKHSF